MAVQPGRAGKIFAPCLENYSSPLPPRSFGLPPEAAVSCPRGPANRGVASHAHAPRRHRRWHPGSRVVGPSHGAEMDLKFGSGRLLRSPRKYRETGPDIVLTELRSNRRGAEVVASSKSGSGNSALVLSALPEAMFPRCYPCGSHGSQQREPGDHRDAGDPEVWSTRWFVQPEVSPMPLLHPSKVEGNPEGVRHWCA